MSHRQSIAVKVAAAKTKGEPVELSPAEALDAQAMIFELGKHEARAVKDSKIISDKVGQIETLTRERNDAERRVNAATRTVRDSFISAALAAGKAPSAAIRIADQTMELRGMKTSSAGEA